MEYREGMGQPQDLDFDLNKVMEVVRNYQTKLKKFLDYTLFTIETMKDSEQIQ